MLWLTIGNPKSLREFYIHHGPHVSKTVFNMIIAPFFSCLQRVRDNLTRRGDLS